MAHREDTWPNPAFQKILLGGIHWAVGDVDADVKPNLDEVCPEAKAMPAAPTLAPAKPTPTPAK